MFVCGRKVLIFVLKIDHFFCFFLFFFIFLGGGGDLTRGLHVSKKGPFLEHFPEHTVPRNTMNSKGFSDFRVFFGMRFGDNFGALGASARPAELPNLGPEA